MKRAELMALHEEARPGVGHTDHEARWEAFATAIWWLLPGIFEEMDRLREKAREPRQEQAAQVESLFSTFEEMLP